MNKQKTKDIKRIDNRHDYNGVLTMRADLGPEINILIDEAHKTLNYHEGDEFKINQDKIYEL